MPNAPEVRIISAGKPHTTQVYVRGVLLHTVEDVQWFLDDDGAYAIIMVKEPEVELCATPAKELPEEPLPRPTPHVAIPEKKKPNGTIKTPEV